MRGHYIHNQYIPREFYPHPLARFHAQFSLHFRLQRWAAREDEHSSVVPTCAKARQTIGRIPFRAFFTRTNRARRCSRCRRRGSCSRRGRPPSPSSSTAKLSSLEFNFATSQYGRFRVPTNVFLVKEDGFLLRVSHPLHDVAAKHGPLDRHL